MFQMEVTSCNEKQVHTLLTLPVKLTELDFFLDSELEQSSMEMEALIIVTLEVFLLGTMVTLDE